MNAMNATIVWMFVNLSLIWLFALIGRHIRLNFKESYLKIRFEKKTISHLTLND